MSVDKLLSGTMKKSEQEIDSVVENKCPTETTDMIPSFTQCRPIMKCSDIEECLTNPPEWVNRVIPLKKRSGFVIKNTLSDCHSTQKHFIPRTRFDSRITPKTLVCHDYKGGYLSDSYIPFEGNEDKTLAVDGYTFYNWSQIDYFVYFSHYFITIPPLAWTNAGHKNGVKVLGTIITENADGVRICNEEIFGTKDQMREFVYQLTEIQKTFGFDGWLLNIENPVLNADVLKEFVETLTRQTHLLDTGSVVLWYDSVTSDGKLQWQDELNDWNKCFFDCCDGIFLNYSWTEEKLKKTVETAGARHLDVYVGIDVFGRNMYGGGQFNTYKAAELISKHNLSMAFFAPGWSHETLEKTPVGTFYSRFLNKDDALWASLWPYLYTHPINNFFETNFHIGLDYNYYNLYVQQQQPSRILHPQMLKVIPNYLNLTTLNVCNCLRRGLSDSRSVVFLSNNDIENDGDNIVHKLFICDIEISGKIGVYFLTRKFSNIDKSVLQLNLLTCLKSGSLRTIKLLGEDKNFPAENMSLLEVNQSRDEYIKYNYALNSIAKRYMKLLSKPYSESTNLSIFEFSTTPSDLLEIGATILNGSSIYLLEFGIVQL